jgi:seryl-tRNA synthetase
MQREQARQLREQIRQAKVELKAATEKSDKLRAKIPNMTHPDAPVGMRLPDGPDREVRFQRGL